MIFDAAECERLDLFARSLEPSARVRVKDDSMLMSFLDIFVHLFNKMFMTAFATTICRTIYIPSSWFGSDLRRLIVHECRHITQCRWCGLGLHPWVGFLPYLLLYALLPFFVGVAYFRYRFELDADAASWKWGLKLGLVTPDTIRARAVTFGTTVSGNNYLFPWPRKLVLRGFQNKAEVVIKEWALRG